MSSTRLADAQTPADPSPSSIGSALPAATARAAPSTPTVSLFEHASDAPLLVACNCPWTLCNYRCHYCYLDHDGRRAQAEELAFDQWEHVIDRVCEIPRPLYLAAGTDGEPLTSPRFWQTLRRLTAHDHVKGIWFPTNLSRPIERMAEGVDVSKLGLTASLHPTEFENHDRELSQFLDRCRWVIDNGGDVVINFILTPQHIPLFPLYRYIARQREIPMTANVFRGEHEGRAYPEAFSTQEHAAMREYFSDRPFVYEFMSGRSSRGVECTAGRDSIHVDATTGAVTNCQFAREPMGSIFDPHFQIRSKTSACSADWCKCHWTNGLISSAAQRYRRTRGIFHFEARPEGDVGSNPFA